MRWTYLVLVIAVLIGLAVNIFVARGWTIWPFVAVVVWLAAINEAADRNGQGIPPFKVYLFFFCGLMAWLIVLMLLMQLNGFVLFIGMAAVVYHAAKGWIYQRERRKLVDFRRANNCCIFCGHPGNPDMVYCENCGEEPNPDTARLARMASIYRGDNRRHQMRAALTREKLGASASRREQALIQKRQQARLRKRT